MFRTVLMAAIGLAACGNAARADETVVPAAGQRRTTVAPLYCPPSLPSYPDCPPLVPTTPGTPGMPPPLDPGMTPVPAPDLGGLSTPFATQTGAGGLQGRSFNESFDGDFGGVFYRRTLVTGTTTTQQQTRTRQQTGTRQVQRVIFSDGVPIRTVTVTVPVFSDVITSTTITTNATTQALVPVPGRYSGISITDNDSPRPTDRLYFNYSYYDGLGTGLNPGLGNITMNRPVLGFEKTFLDRNASIGLRLPFIQLSGPPGVGADSVGDLSILTKYALVNNPNGDVVAAGLILTAPTGPSGGRLSDGSEIPHSVLFQPWLGFVRVYERLYVQGISAAIIPTDGRDVTLLANSLGIGYWLYRADADRILNGIIPVAEVHVRTPLNNRDINGLIYLQDQVNLTGGMHFRFPRATLGGAVCVPVISPRPWNIEAIANLTMRF